MDLISFYKFIGKLIDEGHGSKEVCIKDKENKIDFINKSETSISNDGTNNLIIFSE